MTDDKLSGFLSTERFERKFIPPRRPSFGGLGDAAVKSVKYHLKRVFGKLNLTYEEFLTVRIQILEFLNFRILCHIARNIDDLNFLTRVHFLLGRSIHSIIEPKLAYLNKNILKRWQRETRSVQLNWNKWHRGYISELQQLNKCQFQKERLKIGDMVVLIEDNVPTFRWSKGRVTELYSGKDNLVRVVKVKTEKR
ncbi:integrase catalytic domain-containing protein [Trichonephila clavipes]|nr:integrase catalytic domain-containing protein [Trichonephila clavipes]